MYGQVEAYRAQRKTVISVCKFLFRIQILFAPPTLLFVNRSIVFKNFLLIFLFTYFCWWKILTCDNTADNMVFIVFFLLSRLSLVFLPTTRASLPCGVMLLNCSTTPKDSATNIEKTYQKGTPKQERLNRSVVKTLNYLYSLVHSSVIFSATLNLDQSDFYIHKK